MPFSLKLPLPQGYHGLVFEGSPPFVEDIADDSPLAGKIPKGTKMFVEQLLLNDGGEISDISGAQELTMLLDQYSSQEGRVLVLTTAATTTTTTAVPTDTTVPVMPPLDSKTIGMRLTDGQSFTAVVTYRGSMAGTVETHNLKYVSTTPAELPYAMFHSSDQLLAFVQASIEVNASEAYLYSASAWGLKEGCEKDLKRYRKYIGLAGIVMFVLGFAFMFGIVIPGAPNANSFPWFGMIVSIALLVMGPVLGLGLCANPDPDDEKTRNRIYKKLGTKPPTKAEMATYSFTAQSGV